MPGAIRVSVLEAVDLPEALTDGIVKNVFAKVRLGRRQFETESRVAVRGRIDSWNSAFVFLITNLRDQLVVTICDHADQCLTQTSIEVPSIIEKGCRDEFVLLKGGGRIHLIMNLVLTDQERRKIETMRLCISKKREQEHAKRTIVFQNVQPIRKEFEATAVPEVTITEVDDSSTHGKKDSHESASSPVGFGSTISSLEPMLMFDYARAVGLQSSLACQRAGKRTKFWAADIVSNEMKENMNGLKSDKRVLGNIAENQLGLGSRDTALMKSSVISSTSLQRTAPSLIRSIDIVSSPIVSPLGKEPSPGKVKVGEVKIQAEVLYTPLSKGRDEAGATACDIGVGKRGIACERTCFVLEAEAPIMPNSFSNRSILVGNQRIYSGFHRVATHLAPKGQMLIWNRYPAVQTRSIHGDLPKFEGPTGQGQRLEARPGPGARWALKTGLETRWTSPEKAGQTVRFEWNGQVSDPFRARAKILNLIKIVAGSHEVCGDDRRLEERRSVRENIGDVLNKVVGGAAILLVSLFMMCPIPEGLLHGGDETHVDDS